MPHFFATADDLVSIFETVESKLIIQYTLCDHFDSKNLLIYNSGLQLPTLKQPAPYSTASSCPCYLITERNSIIIPRKIYLATGKTKYAVDQLSCEDSITIWHGGFFGDGVLLSGRIDTISKTTISQKIQRVFNSAIKSKFAKIKAFYVGPKAEQYLDHGCRLTSCSESPSLYDLKR